MKRKKMKKMIVNVMAVSQLMAPFATIPVAYAADTTQEVATPTALSNATQKRYDAAKEKVQYAQSTATAADLRTAIDAFSTIITPDNANANDNLYVLEKDGFRELFNSIFDTIYNSAPTGDRPDLVLYFFNTMAVQLINNDVTVLQPYITLLYDGNNITSIVPKLDASIGMLNYALEYGSGEVDESTGTNTDKSTLSIGSDGVLIVDNYPTASPDDLIVVEIPDEQPADVGADGGETTPGKGIADTQTWTEVMYKIVDGKRVRVTITYNGGNGNVTYETTSEVVGDEDDVYVGTDEERNAYNSGEKTIVTDAIAKDEISEENENKTSNLTLQYTVTKGDKDAYYYDTGIRVTVDGVATYQQLKDTLYQLAVKGDGYLMEDKDKFLVVMEGKSIVIRKEKDEYTKDEMEAIFKEFKTVDIRILETRIGTTVSLEEQLVTGTAQSVELNGEVVKMTTNPSTQNNRVLFPIKEMAERMDLAVEQDGKKLILSKAGSSIVYEEGVKAVIVNGSVVESTTAAFLSDKGILMGELTEMLKLFHYEMLWDEESSTIRLTSQAVEE